MKNIISILLALLILLQSFSKMWIFLSFKFDQDYIAKTLCVNRDKPEMLCSGKCILAQRMKAEDEKEKEQLPQKPKEQEQALYYFDISKWLISHPYEVSVNIQTPTFYQKPFTSAFAESIFHPPSKFVNV